MILVSDYSIFRKIIQNMEIINKFTLLNIQHLFLYCNFATVLTANYMNEEVMIDD